MSEVWSSEDEDGAHWVVFGPFETAEEADSAAASFAEFLSQPTTLQTVPCEGEA